ncbi:hypothetical protein CCR75_002273 [Bremia lactucae]|uniref:Uncharacterized protein n=1 Tax=Bremia lactucae TaxID=4779 RepID=A0A976FMI2_BRELC|nr:hypothetical protein CCR75_002273 [Bremia lactucae]
MPLVPAYALRKSPAEQLAAMRPVKRSRREAPSQELHDSNASRTGGMQRLELNTLCPGLTIRIRLGYREINWWQLAFRIFLRRSTRTCSAIPTARSRIKPTAAGTLASTVQSPTG